MVRLFELFPGALSWVTLLGLIFLSWRLPVVVAVFIVLYDLYWLLKTIYLFFHLRFSFARMKEYLKTDWLAKLRVLPYRDREPRRWDEIFHLVILPMCHEPYELVCGTLRSLAAVNYPLEKLLIVLATEARAGEADAALAARIEEEFGEKFGGFLITTHPAGLPGELPGKGSNEKWGVQRALADLIDRRAIPRSNVLVSVFDIDTRPGPEYFGVLAYHFLTEPRSDRASYQPIPLFINNIHGVPMFARIIAFVATFWQFMQQSRRDQLVTFSSHSMPLEPLVEIGFWDTDIVSEDSRIFFQCLTHYRGDWRTVPLFYPIYMDAVSGPTTVEALKNLYKQQRRWAWGIENIPYVFSRFVRDRGLSLRRKLSWSFMLTEGFYSWATSSFIIFLFGWLPNLLGGDAFRRSVLSANLPGVTGFLINLSTVGIITFAFVSIFLIPPLPTGERLRLRHYALYLFQWFLIPITFIFWSAVPALEAQTRMMLGGRFKLGFWKTPKGAASS
ncbi:MAG: glycosyltransferase family 2 protein [Candidatus Jorgensenbacteria bacterium]